MNLVARTQKDCPKYDRCSAILCPLGDPEEQRGLRGFWVGRDRICTNPEQQDHPIVQMQRRLISASATGLFSLAMIESLCTATHGIAGLMLEDNLAIANIEAKTGKWIKNRAPRGDGAY